MSERDEFEAWAKADGYQIDRVPSQPSLYNWASTQCCWEAWQAARATPQQAVPTLTDEQILNAVGEAHLLAISGKSWAEAAQPIRALLAASPADQVRELIDTAFQAIFDAYNQPGDRFENDYAWCLNVRKKVGDAYTPLQQARAILAAQTLIPR